MMIRQCLSRMGPAALSLAALFVWVGAGLAQHGGGGHGGGGHGGGGGGHAAASFAGGGHAGSFHSGGGSWGHGDFHHGDFGHHDHDRFFFGFGYGYPFYGYGWPYYGYGWPGYYGYYGGYGPSWDDSSYYALPTGRAYLPADYYAGSNLSTVPAPGRPAVPPGVNPNVAHLRIMVPANAQVWFEDEKTDQSGPARFFTSPDLALDKEYVYQIKAEWQEDGRKVSRDRRVMLHAGDWITVDFNRTAKGETLPPPRATN
jgi:uncharacterized protein (TIGR03000 family)